MGKGKYRLSQARKSKKSVMKILLYSEYKFYYYDLLQNLRRWKTVVNLKVEEQSTGISANEMSSKDILDITKSFILYNDALNEVVYDTVDPALVSPEGHSSSRNESDDFTLNLLLDQIVVDANTNESDNVDYCDDKEECFIQYSKTTNEISDHIQNTPDKLVDSVPSDSNCVEYCNDIFSDKNSTIVLKRNHNYFDQVQGLLHITHLCYFVIYTRGGLHIEEIVSGAFCALKMILTPKNVINDVENGLQLRNARKRIYITNNVESEDEPEELGTDEFDDQDVVDGVHL
ncbi:hypothetical protein FQA39_LY17277 [Lamprigera yunnana]|nr:hypothetical protein FQA39_LY17277 [Lamprigera yunnana]